MIVEENIIENEKEEKSKRTGRLFTCRACNFQFNFETEKEKAEWKQQDSSCPKCGERWANKPLTERILFSLQEKLFESKNDFPIEKNPHLIDMYFILVDYSLSFLYKYYIGKIQSNTMAEYYAKRSASLFIERYLKDPEFRVTDSFGGMLVSKGRKGIVSQACFGAEERDLDADSLNIENEKGQQIEYADHSEDMIQKIEDRENTLNNFIYIKELIENIGNYCDSEFEDFSRIVALDIFLNRGEKTTDIFFNKMMEKLGSDGKVGKEMFMKTLEILREELKRMCD